MPKKPRQSHIPAQIRRRKARRPANTALEPAASFEAEVEETYVAPVAAAPIATRTGRRLETMRRAEAPTARVVPGQLPTYAAGYLKQELRQIAITGSSLLAVIIVLAVILR